MTEEPESGTAAHRDAVRVLCRAGGPLDTAGANATTANPRWFFGRDVELATPQRAQLHRRLIAEARAEFPEARVDRRAIVLAGPPGAGKSTVLRNVLGLDKGAWLVVDADEFKQKLLREALADGSYEEFLKPREVAEREAAGERFYPLELAALVHEESSYLARQLRDEALRDGVNVVLDSVLSDPQKAVVLGERLRRAGYGVEVIDVEVPYELSKSRIERRWRQSYENALVTGDGLGGRWVPSVYARDVFDLETGRARSQESAARLAETCATVERYRRFWTSAEGQPPTVETDQSRRQAGAPLIDSELVRNVSLGQGRRPWDRPREVHTHGSER